MKRLLTLLIAVLCLASLLPGQQPVNFVDVARESGLTAVTQSGGEKAKRFILETTGSGIAFFDYDNDGWPDLFVVNGSRLPGDGSDEGATSHLYHNDGRGHFVDVTRQAGVALHGWGQGVCAGDYDNDGYTDLFVTFYGHNALLHNDGKGAFSNRTRESGLDAGSTQWSTGCAFVDVDRDGVLDLFVAHYVDLDLAHTPVPGSSDSCRWKEVAVMCGPRGLKPTHNSLYRGLGGGRFSDISENSGISRANAAFSFTVIAADFNEDGWPDLYVSCDSTPNLFFMNRHDGTFEEQAAKSGVAYNDEGREQAGMGVATADYNGDGHLDLIKTNFSDDTATLYRGEGDGTFTDVTNEAQLARNLQFLGWGVLFEDLNNDGMPDILMANGHVYPEVDTRQMAVRFRERRLLYLNNGKGLFNDVSLTSGPGISDEKNSHGIAAADILHNGRLAVAINNSHDIPSLLRNTSPVGHWLELKLTGTRSNRSAIGARVTLRTGNRLQVQEVRSGGNYMSQSDLALHFGLGTSTEATDIEVRWPSGTMQHVGKADAQQILTITEPLTNSQATTKGK